MSYNRRNVLRAAGTFGTAVALPVGLSVADSHEACFETVDSFNHGATFAGVGVLGQAREDQLPVFATVASDPYSTSEFDEEIDDRRLAVTATWGPAEQGPNDVRIDLQQNLGGWETIAIGETGNATNPAGENRLEFQVADGESGPGAAADAVVDNDVQYRVQIKAQNGSAVQLNVDVELQEIDPGCA